MFPLDCTFIVSHGHVIVNRLFNIFYLSAHCTKMIADFWIHYTYHLPCSPIIIFYVRLKSIVFLKKIKKITDHLCIFSGENTKKNPHSYERGFFFVMLLQNRSIPQVFRNRSVLFCQRIDLSLGDDGMLVLPAVFRGATPCL